MQRWKNEFGLVAQRLLEHPQEVCITCFRTIYYINPGSIVICSDVTSDSVEDFVKNTMKKLSSAKESEKERSQLFHDISTAVGCAISKEMKGKEHIFCMACLYGAKPNEDSFFKKGKPRSGCKSEQKNIAYDYLCSDKEEEHYRRISQFYDIEYYDQLPNVVISWQASITDIIIYQPPPPMEPKLSQPPVDQPTVRPKCFVCRRDLLSRYPTFLPCWHIICDKCALKLSNKKNMKCPRCAKPIKENYLMRKMIIIKQ